VFALLAFAGCCDKDAESSVDLTVVDAEGAPAEATAEYTLDEQDSQPCDNYGGGYLSCGWNEKGAFEIVVEADGYLPEIIEVEVEGDRCNHVRQEVEVVMETDEG